MEEIPHFPEGGTLSSKEQASSEKAADWLLSHEKTAPIIPPLHYELKVSPPKKARMELKNKPEIDFERRHEVLEEHVQSEHAVSGMIPLSQVLAQYPQKSYVQSAGPSHSADGSGSIAPRRPRPKASDRSLYRRAIAAGVIGGAIVLITMYLLIIR